MFELTINYIWPDIEFINLKGITQKTISNNLKTIGIQEEDHRFDVLEKGEGE